MPEPLTREQMLELAASATPEQVEEYIADGTLDEAVLTAARRGTRNEAIQILIEAELVTEAEAEEIRDLTSGLDGTDRAVYEIAVGEDYIQPKDLDDTPAIPYTSDQIGSGEKQSFTEAALEPIGDFFSGLWQRHQQYRRNTAAHVGRVDDGADLALEAVQEAVDKGNITESQARQWRGRLNHAQLRVRERAIAAARDELEGKVDDETYAKLVGATVLADPPLSVAEAQRLIDNGPEAGLPASLLDDDGQATTDPRFAGIPDTFEDEDFAVPDSRIWMGDPPPGFKPGVGVGPVFLDYEKDERGQYIKDDDGELIPVYSAGGQFDTPEQNARVMRGIYEFFPALRTTAVHDATGAQAAMFREQAAEYRQDDPRGLRLRYYQGDEMSLRWWSAVSVRALQTRLENGMYLERKTYSPGMADHATVEAFAFLLADSNISGQTYSRELTWKIQKTDPEQLDWFHNGKPPKPRDEIAPPVPKIRPFVAPSFLKPDIASLNQGVKQSVREKLGREPTDAEMRELVASLDSDYRSQYKVEVAGLRSEYDAEVAAYQSGAYEAGEPTYGSGGEFRTVDPSSQFAETFENRYSGELDLIRRNESTEQAQAQVNAAIGRLTNMMTGGGR